MMCSTLGMDELILTVLHQETGRPSKLETDLKNVFAKIRLEPIKQFFCKYADAYQVTHFLIFRVI